MPQPVDKPRAEAALRQHLQLIGYQNPNPSVEYVYSLQTFITKERKECNAWTLEKQWSAMLTDLKQYVPIMSVGRSIPQVRHLTHVWQTLARDDNALVTEDFVTRELSYISTSTSTILSLSTATRRQPISLPVTTVASPIASTPLLVLAGTTGAHDGAWAPFEELAAAGIWLVATLHNHMMLLPFPAISLDDRERLHCVDGPAVSWPQEKHFYWHGIAVEQDLVLHPERITAQQIAAQQNIEVRRVLLERFGTERFMSEIGATLIHKDDWGTLYRYTFHDSGWQRDEPIVMVKVVNSTPESDGSRATYWLRVPPDMRTAKEAVAWSFGKDVQSYAPSVET